MNEMIFFHRPVPLFSFPPDARENRADKNILQYLFSGLIYVKIYSIIKVVYMCLKTVSSDFWRDPKTVKLERYRLLCKRQRL